MMITCSNCNSLNEDGSQFCIRCGKPLENLADPVVDAPDFLTGNQPAPVEPASPQPAFVEPKYYQPANAPVHAVSPVYQPVNQTLPSRQLGIATGRVIIGALLVWFLRAVLLSFSFTAGTIFPEYAITVESFITLLAYLAIIGMLLSYAGSLSHFWPRAFPQVASATTALTAVVYLIALGMAYTALRPFLAGILDNPGEIIRWLNVILSVIALALLAWAVKIIYDALPAWLDSIHFDSTPSKQGRVACLFCGHLNSEENVFCGHCGRPLTKI